ncbi:class I adenylate-forming enzyme family protein [Lentzea albida]|uniref:Amino acid adenylation domain-containing protein n=1 Tax=Lentzea albida TaxID=65499 RepID=A0A1H9V5C0_9PSEU|nr:class I adenylate-forming enzyme family protein [Lentzea albida]SES16936.1 amino acid adenylation domain-containing protein [Lentzea albida]
MTAFLLHHLLDRRAELTPDAPAVRRGERTWTYHELRTRSVAYAEWLRDRGVVRGDRVLLLAPHALETTALVHACSRLGALHVVLSDRIRPYHLDHILGDSEPRLVLATDEAAGLAVGVPVHRLAELPATPSGSLPAGEPCAATDPVALIYTSGSTSMPKAVISTHAQVLFAASAINARLGYRADDVVFCCLPLSFDYGQYQMFLSCRAGACLVVGDDGDAGPTLLRRLTEHGTTVFPLVPSLASTLGRLVGRAGRPPERLRMVTNTGAALPVTASVRLREAVPGLEVVAMFGLTECKRVSIAEPNADLTRPGSCGLPLPGTEAYAADEDGHRLPAGETGELVVRGPNVMAGYWRAPDLTARRFRRDAFGQPVLHTGDRCRFDEDGHLYFVGRDDDIYKQRGIRMSCLEIEAAALDVPGVELAALLPPDEASGARLAVAGDLLVPYVVQQLGVRLEEQKLPSQVVVLDALPLSVNGKVDKKGLAELLAGQGGAS